jgi:putative membrane protein
MNRKIVFQTISVASGALLAGAVAFGQMKTGSSQTTDQQQPMSSQSQSESKMGTTASTTGSNASLDMADKSFVMKAAKGGLAEVEFGRLAAEKATDPDVKQFGQKMVDDHSKANDELKTIAQQKGLTLPAELDAKDKRTRDHLAKLSGAAFDRAYMSTMVKDHTTDVSEFRKESKTGKDSDVKSFADKTLPTLEEHLKLARQDKAKVAGGKAEGTTKKTSGY